MGSSSQGWAKFTETSASAVVPFRSPPTCSFWRTVSPRVNPSEPPQVSPPMHDARTPSKGLSSDLTSRSMVAELVKSEANMSENWLAAASIAA